MKVTIRQLGPGMVQQMQSVCPDCRGEGSMIADKDRCKVCNGKKTVKETKVLEVHVDKGVPDGHKIYFRGEGDQEVDNLNVFHLIVHLIFRSALNLAM